MTFDKLGLDKPILNTLQAQGYEQPTPIQSQAIPFILKGRDVVGLAQTGTGKTAAFTLPLLQRLSNNKTKVKPGTVRVLILSPTRELAAQIHKSVRDYGRKLSLKSACVVGGVAVRPQRKALEGGVDVLVATPGRLEDLIQQRAVRLGEVETIVLDEADQMLDIGFMPAILRILKLLPSKRQTLLFSATMPREIRDLSQKHLHKPEKVSVAPVSSTAAKVVQNVMHVPHDKKLIAMIELLKEQKEGERVIVFTRTKRGADKVAKRLNGEDISAAAIHGNKTQGQRQRALDGFRKGTCKVLIATDIAARGIDVPGVGMVINYELPNIPESYVHRIGRTARAGASGIAVSFCGRDERSYLRDIERLIRQKLNVLPTPEFDPETLRAFAARAPRKDTHFVDSRAKRKRPSGDRSKRSDRGGAPGRAKKSEWTPTAEADERPTRRRKAVGSGKDASNKGQWTLKPDGDARSRNGKTDGVGKSKWRSKSEDASDPSRSRKADGTGKSQWRSKSDGDGRPARSNKSGGTNKSQWRSKSDGDARPARGGKPGGSAKPNRGGPKAAGGGGAHRSKPANRRGSSKATGRRQAAAAH
ncbi:MAG: DEAD/DEAH box helicase [Hyphomicrobiaceae bacterium]